MATIRVTALLSTRTVGIARHAFSCNQLLPAQCDLGESDLRGALICEMCAENSPVLFYKRVAAGSTAEEVCALRAR